LQIIKEIAASGIKVIIAGSSVSDRALHHLNHHSIAVLKVPSKSELRRLCRVVNATPLEHMGTPTPAEAGWVDVYETVELDGARVTVLRQLVAGDPGFETSGAGGDGRGEKTRTATIVLRATTAERLDALAYAADDGVHLVRLLLRDKRLVPGAGAAELELARRVEVYAGKVKGSGRDVVKRFAKALEVIPRTLVENAKGRREGDKVVRQLWGAHDTTELIDGAGWGVDVKAEPPSDGTVLTNPSSVSYPILDLLAVKRHAIELATQTAGSVLSIDSNIMTRRVASAGVFGVFNAPLKIVINTSVSHITMMGFLTGMFSTIFVFILIDRTKVASKICEVGRMHTLLDHILTENLITRPVFHQQLG
jgi:chaperonin GroEL (HSP60 family)